jgi:tRNA threonylcarbamoyladenosine biosynthesis protein TsaE
LKQGELSLMSHHAEQTQRIGIRLGGLLRPGDVVCLSGAMGAGKTALSAGIGQGWGATFPLTSPTFNLVHDHTRAADATHLYHLDCYRLSGPQEADGIGLEDILDGRGIVLVEWAEHVLPALPREHLWIELQVLEPTRRSITFEPKGAANHARYTQLMDQFRAASFGV